MNGPVHTSQESTNLNQTGAKTDYTQLAVAVLVFGVFSLAFFNTAWISDDAFITFRVVDNTLNGYGPIWNIGERVQVFTHPLWYGLLVLGVYLLGDPFYTALLLSYACLLTTLTIIWMSVSKWNLATVLITMALLWSQAYVDFLSSGLENPLTHALVAIFFLVAMYDLTPKTKTLSLAFVSSLIFLNRPDAVLLAVPVMLLQLWRQREALGGHILLVVTGLIPALLWLVFSLIYYGSPVPNTALAKVATDLSLSQRITQGWQYIQWSIQKDIVTPILLAAGAITGLASRNLWLKAFGISLPLWLTYLMYIGGDFMGGRFLSAPVLLAALTCLASLKSHQTKLPTIAIALLLLTNLKVLGSTIFSPIDYSRPVIDQSGIANERGFYYPALGLKPVLGYQSWRVHPWLVEGYKLRDKPGIYTRCATGMAGYAGGPDLYWIDPLALSEPFLARLPARSNSRIGHYERALPPGYLESRLAHENRIKDNTLSELYRDVALASQAPLLTAGRASAIWRLNTEYYDQMKHGYDKEAIGLPGVPVKTDSPFSCYGIPYGADGTWRIQADPTKATRVILQLR